MQDARVILAWTIAAGSYDGLMRRLWRRSFGPAINDGPEMPPVRLSRRGEPPWTADPAYHVVASVLVVILVARCRVNRRVGRHAA